MSMSPARPALSHIPMVGGPIRVLIVDDSVVIRQLITRMLSSSPEIEVVGSARNGKDALIKVEQLRPDVVTLDIEMPEMNGIEALGFIKQRFPAIRVIMCSRLTERGAAVTIDALLKGADDYVNKDHSTQISSDYYEILKESLLSKIKQVGRRASKVAKASVPITASPAVVTPVQKQASWSNKAGTQILAIGVSTGGPSALATVAAQLPPNFPVPIVIVQHMPPFFTGLLAERLTKLGPTKVVEAQQGMLLEPGTAYIAPGDYHMGLHRKSGTVQVVLNQEAQENSCRHAVDVLFRSVAELYGASCLAVVLTGMGQDGLQGVRVLKASGAKVLVQDRDSSVVWGMPGAVADANLADAVLPLTEIVPAIMRQL